MAGRPLPVPDNTPASSPSSPAMAAASGVAVPTHELVSYLQRSLSTLSLDRAAEEEEDEDEDDDDDSLGIEKAITIAISGATSSGKTTLAILLAEIFDAAPFSTGAMVLHEDNWFFHKGACEIVSYPSKKKDAEFCRASLSALEGSGYSISSEGNDEFRVSGPDTDHFSAINFWGLLKAVMFVKEKGSLPKIAEDKFGVRGKRFILSLIEVYEDRIPYQAYQN